MNELVLLYESQNSSIIIGWALQKDSTDTEIDGNYKANLGDDINYRYETLEILGKGTFGQVLKVYDHAEKKIIAMKIIKNKQIYFEQSLIEVEILKLLSERYKESKNSVVIFEGSFVFRNHMVCVM